MIQVEDNVLINEQGQSNLSKDIDIQRLHPQPMRPANQRLTLDERIHIVHLYMQHKLTVAEISVFLGMKYPTVRSVVEQFKNFGTVNKFLNLYEKKQLLKCRTKLQNKHHKLHKNRDPKKGVAPIAKKSNRLQLYVKVPDSRLKSKTRNTVLGLQLASPSNAEAKNTWLTFAQETDEVESCEYEYKISSESNQYRQPNDVFSGTLEAMNFEGLMQNSSLQSHLLQLPSPDQK